MKKLLYSVAALATIFLAGSCQQESLEPAVEGTSVSFAVEVPDGISTKAVADGCNVDVLYYAIYKNGEGRETHENGVTNPNATPLASGFVKKSEDKIFNMTFDLLVDQEYVAIFWAQVGEAKKYYVWPDNGDLREIRYSDDMGVIGNMEDRAAFFRTYEFETYEVLDHDIKLYRPFAQLNLGTSLASLEPSQTGEVDHKENEDYVIDVLTSQVTVTGLATSFNTIAGIEVGEEMCGAAGTPTQEKFIFKMHDVITTGKITDGHDGREYLVVKNKEGVDVSYEYVAMNYLFANGNITVEYDIVTDKGTVNNTVTNVPVMENFRTNLIGNLLTSKTDFEIVVDETFVNWPENSEKYPEYDVYVWNGTAMSMPEWVAEDENFGPHYQISTADQLAGFAALINGNYRSEMNASIEKPADPKEKTTKFVLMADIDLNSLPWTPIGATNAFLGTFDGNGKTISNLYVKTEGKASAGLFGSARNVMNLTVKNAVVEGNYKAGVISGDGLCSKIENCHVENATVVSTPYNKDDANHVGGIVGYLSAEPTAYVKGSSVKKAEIRGYRDVGGIVGTVTGGNNVPDVTGNTVEDVDVVADQTYEYGEAKAANVGAVIGRMQVAANVSDNTVGDDVTTVVEVETAAQLQNAVDMAASDVYVVLTEDTKGDVTVTQKEGVDIVIDGGKHVYDGTIYIHGQARFEGAETLTIKNVSFKHEGSNIDFISCNSTESAKRYAHNVTIEDCTFEGDLNYEVVAARFRQCYNITIKKVNAANLHSLMWATGGKNFVIDGVEAVGKNGISFGTTVNCTVKNSTINTEAYGIRADGSVETNLSIENTTIEADVPVIVRKNTSNYTVVLNNATLVKKDVFHVVFTKGGDDEAYVASESYTISGAENYVVFPITTTGNYTDEQGNTVAQTEAGLKEALEKGQSIILANPFTIDQSESNGYGKTGINMTNGGTLDGNGNELGAPGSTGTWDSAINTSGGTIKNIKVTKGFRGIFIKKDSKHNERLFLDNVIIDGTTYTISCDSGNRLGLEATNSTFKGWTSFAATLGEAKFTECYFGYGNGYAYCRPYAPTTFVGCEFEAEFQIDPRAVVTFINCKYDGKALTVENIETLVTNNISNVRLDGMAYHAAGAWVGENGTSIATSQEGLNTLLPMETVSEINLVAGNFDVNLYDGKNSKDQLSLVGREGTKVAFKNLQVRAELFNELTISNCEILRMPDKSWGHLVFADSKKAAGKYTVSNCTFNGAGSQGIYINETVSGATYTIENCTFNGDFGGEGAVTIQNNDGVNHTVNVTDCTFSTSSNFIYMLYSYKGWTLNTDVTSANIFWKE